MSATPYALQCCVERDNVRTLRSMLQCLDRFGKELFLEANEGEVTLRTLNSAQSAFIIFSLRGDHFFSAFNMERGANASVKLHLKNFTSIFRSIAGVEKVWLQVALGGEDGEDAYMRVQLQCSSGLRKKFDLSFQEVTSMNAVYDKSRCPHHLCADPGIFLECLKNFPTSLAEVSLLAAPDALMLKNEVETSTEETGAGHVRTEMQIPASDLREYLLGPNGVSIAFSQREFKAVLSLVKDLDHLLTASIEGPGRPIIFGTRIKRDDVAPFVVECVLATVVETTSMGEEDLFGDDFDPRATNVPYGSAPVYHEQPQQYTYQPSQAHPSQPHTSQQQPSHAPPHHQHPRPYPQPPQPHQHPYAPQGYQAPPSGSYAASHSMHAPLSQQQPHPPAVSCHDVNYDSSGHHPQMSVGLNTGYQPRADGGHPNVGSTYSSNIGGTPWQGSESHRPAPGPISGDAQDLAQSGGGIEARSGRQWLDQGTRDSWLGPAPSFDWRANASAQPPSSASVPGVPELSSAGLGQPPFRRPDEHIGSDSDTEEDAEAVPGTPPDGYSEGYPSKRICSGSPNQDPPYGGWH